MTLALLPSWTAFAGVFVPVLGVVGTIVLAALTTGRTRWMVLAATPTLVFTAFSALMPSLQHDVNVAARMYVIYTLALLWYYPVLLLAGALALYRTTRNRDWEPVTRKSGVRPMFSKSYSGSSSGTSMGSSTTPPKLTSMVMRLDRRELG